MSMHKVVVRGTIIEGPDIGTDIREEIDVENNPRIGDTLYSKNLDARFVVDDVVEGSMEDTFPFTTVYRQYPMSGEEYPALRDLADPVELQERFNNLPGVYTGGENSLIQFADRIGDCPDTEPDDVYIDAVWRDVTSVEDDLELKVEEVNDCVITGCVVIDKDGKMIIPADWSYEDVVREYGAIELGREDNVGTHRIWAFKKIQAIFCIASTFTMRMDLESAQRHLNSVKALYPDLAMTVGYNSMEGIVYVTAPCVTANFIKEALLLVEGISTQDTDGTELLILPPNCAVAFEERYTIVGETREARIPTTRLLDDVSYSVVELTSDMFEELDLVEICPYGKHLLDRFPTNDAVQILRILLPETKVFFVYERRIFTSFAGSKSDRILLRVAKELVYAYFGVSNRDKLHKAIDKLCMAINVWAPPAIYLCPVEFLLNLNQEFITEFLKYLFRLDRDKNSDDVCSKVKKCKYPAELISELQAYASPTLQYPISTIGLYAPAEIRNQSLYRQLADADDVELLKQLVQEMSQLMLHEKPKALGLLLSAHQSNLDNQSKERVIKELHKYIK